MPRVPQDVETTALISLGKSAQTTDTQLTWDWLNISDICSTGDNTEPSNALGLFCKNLLVKPLSSRDLILLG